MVFALSKTLLSQSIFKDSIIDYRVSMTYATLNTISQLRGSSEFGPLGFEGQKYLTKNWSVGLEYFTFKRPYESSDLVYYDVKTSYSGKTKENQFLIKTNYYLTFHEAQSRFLQHFNIYGSLGLGIGLLKSNLTSTSIDGSSSNKTIKDQYFVAQFTIGTEYEFNNHFGCFIETGYSLSRFQTGLFYKF
jgi:hypothetical protein